MLKASTTRISHLNISWRIIIMDYLLICHSTLPMLFLFYFNFYLQDVWGDQVSVDRSELQHQVVRCKVGDGHVADRDDGHLDQPHSHPGNDQRDAKNKVNIPMFYTTVQSLLGILDYILVMVKTWIWTLVEPLKASFCKGLGLSFLQIFF